MSSPQCSPLTDTEIGAFSLKQATTKMKKNHHFHTSPNKLNKIKTKKWRPGYNQPLLSLACQMGQPLSCPGEGARVTVIMKGDASVGAQLHTISQSHGAVAFKLVALALGCASTICQASELLTHYLRALRGGHPHFPYLDKKKKKKAQWIVARPPSISWSRAGTEWRSITVRPHRPRAAFNSSRVILKPAHARRIRLHF